MAGMAGIFKTIAGAKTFETGTYFEPGEYELDVLEYFHNTGHKGECGIAEFVVVSSKSTEYDAEGKERKPAPVGSRRSAVYKLDGEHKAVGQGKMKAFTLALCVPAGTPVSDDDIGATLADILGDACRTDSKKNSGCEKGAVERQPMRGKRVKLYASTASKATKKGVIPVNLKFVFVEQTDEAVAARRAELDAANL